MTIQLFNAGLFYADGGAMFGAVPRTAWGRRYEADHLNRCVLAMQIGLVRVEDRILLIDTGVGTKHLERLSRSYYAFHQLTDPTVTLARLGIRPDDVTDVILTHLHFDHCGGTTRMDDLGRIVATYPRARVHVSRAQLDACAAPNALIQHLDSGQRTQFREAVADLRVTEPTDDDALLLALLQVFERGDNRISQQFTLTLIAGLGLTPLLAKHSDRFLAALPNADPIVVKFAVEQLLPLGLDTDHLTTLALDVLARKEKGVKRTVLKALRSMNNPSQDLVEMLTATTTGPDSTTAELALRVTGAIRTHGRKLRIMPWNKEIERRYHCRHGSTLASGHLLLYRGQSILLRSSSMGFVVKKHPRSAIALTSRGTVLFVTVDGRHPGYAGGMNLIELRHFLQQLGCTDAINLDGGGSTTLWAKGFSTNGVANYPCDNRKFDHDGERKVANAVVVMKRGK